jgi:hypothetical protein
MRQPSLPTKSGAATGTTGGRTLRDMVVARIRRLTLIPDPTVTPTATIQVRGVVSAFGTKIMCFLNEN